MSGALSNYIRLLSRMLCITRVGVKWIDVLYTETKHTVVVLSMGLERGWSRIARCVCIEMLTQEQQVSLFIDVFGLCFRRQSRNQFKDSHKHCDWGHSFCWPSLAPVNNNIIVCGQWVWIDRFENKTLWRLCVLFLANNQQQAQYWKK